MVSLLHKASIPSISLMSEKMMKKNVALLYWANIFCDDVQKAIKQREPKVKGEK